MKRLPLLLLLPVLLLAKGCVVEDQSSCPQGLNVSFSYLKNNTYTDLFEEQVQQVSVYVFDGQGLYVKEITQPRKDLTGGNTMYIPLDKGQYTLVAFAGLLNKHEMVDIAGTAGYRQLYQGVSKLEDIRLIVKGTTDPELKSLNVSGLEDLFFGISENCKIVKGETEHCAIDLTKNTNTIKVTVNGLDNISVLELAKGSPEGGTDNPCLNVMFYGTNGMYRHDNSADINFSPLEYSIDNHQQNDLTLTTSTKVLRLLLGGDMNIKVLSATGRAIFSDNLMPLILKNPKYKTQDDIDRDDEFEFVYDIIKTDRGYTVTVSVNGWVVIDAVPMM